MNELWMNPLPYLSGFLSLQPDEPIISPIVHSALPKKSYKAKQNTVRVISDRKVLNWDPVSSAPEMWIKEPDLFYFEKNTVFFFIEQTLKSFISD